MTTPDQAPEAKEWSAKLTEAADLFRHRDGEFGDKYDSIALHLVPTLRAVAIFLDSLPRASVDATESDPGVLTEPTVTPPHGDAPFGTFNCPICNRDFPHSALFHSGDVDALIALLQQGKYCAERLVRLKHHEKEPDAERFILQVGGAIAAIRKNPYERVAAGVYEAVSCPAPSPTADEARMSRIIRTTHPATSGGETQQ